MYQERWYSSRVWVPLDPLEVRYLFPDGLQVYIQEELVPELVYPPRTVFAPRVVRRAQPRKDTTEDHRNKLLSKIQSLDATSAPGLTPLETEEPKVILS